MYIYTFYNHFLRHITLFLSVHLKFWYSILAVNHPPIESDVEGLPDYSDIENYARVGDHTPESSVNGENAGSWEGSSCSEGSCSCSDGESSFYAEADFAQAVTQAAENVGMKVQVLTIYILFICCFECLLRFINNIFSCFLKID